MKHSPLESDNLVKIHGNWCGPNWTGGRRLSARQYDVAGHDWNSIAISPLDEACRDHDYAGRSGTMPAAADTRLIEAAEKRILSWLDQLKLQALIINPFTPDAERKKASARLNESSDAALISTGIFIARATRRT